MTQFQIWTIRLLTTTFLISYVSSRNAYKVIPIVTCINIKNNLKYLNSSATLRNTPTETKVNVEFTVTRTMPDPWINFAVWVDMGTGTVHPPLQNSTFDFCEFLKNPGLHRLGQIVHREVKRTGIIPNCPIGPGPYKFYDISTGAMRLPAFIPVAKYIMQLLLSVGNEIVYESRWYGTLKRVKCTGNMRC